MLTLIFGILSALLFGTFSWGVLGFGPILTGLFTLTGFLAVVIPINLWLKKKTEAIFTSVQKTIEKDQDRMRRQANQLQVRMMGSPKGIQKQIEKQQADSIRQALKQLEAIGPLKKWNVMAQRQADTVRGQLLYQIRDFAAADPYLARSLNLDVMTVAMKMARCYQNNKIDELEKLYKKVKRRFKGDKGILIHCLYAWALVKKGRHDEALELLTQLKEKTDNQVVRDNWEHLANGRIKKFSNAGLGEMWYALHLEQPRVPRIKQHGAGRRR